MHRPIEDSTGGRSNGFNTDEVKCLNERVMEIFELDVGPVPLPVYPCELCSVRGLCDENGKPRQYGSKKLLHLVNLQGLHTVLQFTHQVLVELRPIGKCSHAVIQVAEQLRDLSVCHSHLLLANLSA